VAWTGARAITTGLGCLLLSAASPAPLLAWWNDAWGVRVKITFDNSAQAQNLVNFPVLIRLDSSRIEYFRTQDAGQDIRFVDADDTTVLAHEIETWNEAGSSYVWVRVPQVDASSSTDFIWMYYGNVNAADGQNATAVWSASYRGVWHLKENPAGAAPQMRDSTSNASHGTSSGGMTAAQQVPGRFGGALNFDGNDDYVSGSIPAAPTQYTYEAWINRNTTLFPEHHILALSNTQFFVEDNDKLEAGTTSEFNVNGPTSILPNTWYYAVFVQAASGWTIYLDGLVEASGPQTTAPGTGFFIGVYPVPASGGNFPGLIDEARISDTPRSAAWIAAQYKSMSDTFATYGAPAAGPCCWALTTTPAGSNVTVTSPASFEMTFDQARGGGLANFYDLAEDPGRAYDLAGKPSVNFYGLFHSSMMSSGVLYTTGTNSTGAKVDLLEATPVRVRVRQEAFFQRVPAATAILPGVKGIGNYSVYPERVAVRWNRKTTTAVPQEDHPLEISTRREVSPDPRDSVTLYSESDTTFPNPATDRFVLAQHDVAGVRTDVLGILYANWPEADNLTASLTGAYFSWRDNPAVTPVPAGVGPYSQQPGEAWNFLIHYKPTNFLTNVDPAVTTRRDDYRTPDALSVTVGGPWIDPLQNTAGGDDFDEAEAAYLLTLDPNPGQGLSFQMDGTVAAPRYSPFFRIRQWRSLTDTPVVRLNGSLLRKDVDFRGAVKPLARAHWASTLSWHCTMESTTACDSANLDVGTGVAGSTSGTVTTQAGRYGNGLVFNENSDSVTAASSDFNRNVGAVDFWYQPFYNHNDGVPYLLWYSQGGVVGNYGCFYLAKLASNDLAFGVVSGATDQSCTVGGTTYAATAPSTAYSWRAYDWVHLKTSWNSSGLAGSRKLRIVMNGVEIATSATFVAPATSSTPIFGGCSLNCPGTPGANANGVIDEAYIYRGLDYNAYDTNSPFAHAGLTSDAGEYLADPAKSWSLGLTPVGSGRAGSYLYFGSDSPFRGLNVALATPGVWSTTAGDLVWEFWNGTQWATLESGYGFTDTTVDFTRNGTVYWTGDPFNWAPYSVNGGPDLYYVRLHLAGGALTYSTQPVERMIKTDILLFQYCGDIAAATQTFQFAVPAPTAVRLMSFSALPGDGSVTLEWKTGSELDNLGFHLYRGSSTDGPWARLTSSLIPGLGSSPLGQAYSWLDTGLTNGVRYYYRLEDVDTSSRSSFHGPVSATPEAAVPPPPGGGGDGGGGGGAGGGGSEPGVSSCPSWVLAAAPDAVSPVCTRHGDPDSVSLQVLARDGSSATLELRTGGFWALREAAGEVRGEVRVFVPGLEFPSDPTAPALPLRRALVDAVVGKQVELVSAEALDLRTFRELRPSAIGAAELSVGRDGTVRLARRAVAAPLALRGYQPRELARLVGTAFQGVRKSAVVEITPVRFSGAGLVLARLVRVKLAFTGVVEGESGAGSRGRSAPRRKPLFQDVLAQLHTSSKGLHAVAFEHLFPQRPRGFSTRFLRLQRQGEAVAFHVEPAGPVFGPGSVLYFYADRTASSPEYSPEMAYELVRSSGVQVGVVSAPPLGPPVASPSTGFASFETNRIYQPGLLEAEDVWLWEYVASGARRAPEFTLSGVDGGSSQPARLVVHLQGGSESGQAVDHHLELEVNGVRVGETSFAGKRPHEVELAVAASLLEEGTNTLGLTNVGDTGVVSRVYLDRFEISYPQAPLARGGVFEGVWAETGTVEVAGVSGVPVILRDSARWLTGFETTPGSVRFQAEAGHRYLVVSAQGLLSPRIRRVPRSTLRNGANQADYVVIAPGEFLEAAAPLVERRRSQGLRSQVVSFEEIVSEFGHGQPSAEAIRAFLAYAFHSWQRPSPRYVLLLGDATDDPRRFLSTSWASPLPALPAKTSYLWTVSDPALGAVNGEDLLPDLAIGRLPATTVEQARALVSKVLAWEDSGQGLSGRAVLVADTPDQGGDFEADVEDVRARFLYGRETTTLRVGELGAATRGAILDAFDEGSSLMSYVGHGGTAVWSSSTVLSTWDVPSLRAQSRQPVLLTLDCLNGYFVAPNFDALPEALLKAQGRGVVAAVSPSGLSLDGPAHEYHRAVMAELVSGRHERLGDAILAAQRDYAETGLMPELLSVYQLLGDPAMRMKP
jgi:Peptidase family C25/Concanavalin A-like lectin/glucanases superfamily/Domain of unknown function (DUF2341)